MQPRLFLVFAVGLLGGHFIYFLTFSLQSLTSQTALEITTMFLPQHPKCLDYRLLDWSKYIYQHIGDRDSQVSMISRLAWSVCTVSSRPASEGLSKKKKKKRYICRLNMLVLLRMHKCKFIHYAVGIEPWHYSLSASWQFSRIISLHKSHLFCINHICKAALVRPLFAFSSFLSSCSHSSSFCFILDL